jgi:hypothetical protein
MGVAGACYVQAHHVRGLGPPVPRVTRNLASIGPFPGVLFGCGLRGNQAGALIRPVLLPDGCDSRGGHGETVTRRDGAGNPAWSLVSHRQLNQTELEGGAIIRPEAQKGTRLEIFLATPTPSRNKAAKGTRPKTFSALPTPSRQRAATGT